jgi:hypothetical protein
VGAEQAALALVGVEDGAGAAVARCDSVLTRILRQPPGRVVDTFVRQLDWLPMAVQKAKDDGRERATTQNADMPYSLLAEEITQQSVEVGIGALGCP